jgi:HD superfamily phosphohydrolase
MHAPALLPELSAPTHSVRIPEFRQVPLTRRLIAVIDHPAFQRLRRVRQLGPIHLVYPGAVHTRFEHSLGVYDLARQYLLALLRDPHAAASLTEADLLCCLLGGLLHDLGHYPFAHSLEALHLAGGDAPRHEDLVADILRGDIPALSGEVPLGEVIRRGFGLDPEEVIDFIRRKPHQHQRPERRLVATVISSGIDADKADYLERDSIHMGVSYGRNYDRVRLLDALVPHPDGDRIAVSDKGRVSAEMFVFCRYTMFSEAYWHHAVRSVSAMMERALAASRAHLGLDGTALRDHLLATDDDGLLAWLMMQAPADSEARALLEGMTGGRRAFYRRVLALNRAWEDEARQQAYDRIYALDRTQTLALQQRLCRALEALVHHPVALHEVIIDTPPRDKDRVETVDIVHGSGATPLPRISRVVQGIATDFIKVVKKIRVFVHPALRARIDATVGRDAVSERLLQTILDYHPEDDAQQRLW